MSLSKVAYTAAPAQTVFAITFDVLSSDYVHVYLDTVELVQPTEFTVNSARTQVTLVTPATGGEYVLLKRQTPTDPIVDWQPGGAILDEDLDTMYTQLMHLVQERQDDSDESMRLRDDGSGNWDADSRRITNMDDGVDNQDAVTKFQLDDAQMQAGNLPVVTGADNDKFIQVKAGAWVTRTPAQVEADIGVDTLQSQMATAQADITALEAGQPLAVANVTNATLVNASETGTWMQAANTRLALSSLAIVRNNGTPHFTLGADTLTIEEDGTYLVEVQVWFTNLEAAEDVAVVWELTDGVDGGGQVRYIRGLSTIMERTGAVPIDRHNMARRLTTVTVSGTPKVLVLRAIAYEVTAPPGTSTVRVNGEGSLTLQGSTFLRVERMTTP